MDPTQFVGPAGYVIAVGWVADRLLRWWLNKRKQQVDVNAELLRRLLEREDALTNRVETLETDLRRANERIADLCLVLAKHGIDPDTEA